MRITLNFKGINNKKEMHEYLKTKFDLPDYYTDNLDGLWDLLTEINENTIIKILNSDELILNLNKYGESTISLFRDLELENKKIEVLIEK